MKTFGAKAFALGIVCVMGGLLLAQPGSDPGEKKKDGKKGPPDGKKGPPPYELGKVLPPFIRKELDLTEDQQKKISDLEKGVRSKLESILTPEQLEKIQSLSPKGPKGPPDGKEGKDKGPNRTDPDGKGPKKAIPERPPLEGRLRFDCDKAA